MLKDSIASPREALLRHRSALFESHCGAALDAVLDPWAAEFIASPRFDRLPHESQSPVAVVVDDRPSRLLRFAVLNTLLLGRLSMRVVVMTTSAASGSMRDLFADLKGWVDVRALPAEIEALSVNAYNGLLMSASFWEALPADHIFVFQTDGLLVEPLDLSLFEYDYIGAPWTRDYVTSEVIRLYSPSLQEEVGVFCVKSATNDIYLGEGLKFGNGGMSIRNRGLMQRICVSEVVDWAVPEDLFFSRALERYGASLPPLEVARRFSCETVYAQSLMAHKSHHYLAPGQQAELMDRHFKTMMSMAFASLS